MVRALLDGRKTQTRRIIKPQLDCEGRHHLWPDKPASQPTIDEDGLHCGICGAGVELDHRRKSGVRCIPIRYAVGDVLWVRETFHLTDDGHNERAAYTADEVDAARHVNEVGNIAARHGLDAEWLARHVKKRPSIHMPRWASRLTLAVTGVKVERLQDISDADALAEGVSLAPSEWNAPATNPYVNLHDVGGYYSTPARAFEYLWRDINDDDGPASYLNDPWVVAVTFTVHQQNVDAYLAQRQAA